MVILRKMMQMTLQFHYGIVQRLRAYNLNFLLPLRVNAIVDEHVAVAVVFTKLSNSVVTEVTRSDNRYNGG